ncbi:MAG: PaaI family thioesterase [Anaerolineae bacterium]|nr:MAG: PaaI family thioesterase [Anaerolineae bacterium]
MPKTVPQTPGGFNPFGELIGLRFSKIEDGSSQCQLEVTESLLNPYGVVHGGVIYSLADTAMGGALYSVMSEEERCVTVEMKMAYIRPATDGTLNCTAAVVHRSKRLGYLESEVKSGDRLVAKASATFSIFAH